MNPYLKRAQEIAAEITENRRYIHAHAGVGFDLGDTVDRIMSQLEAMGIQGESSPWASLARPSCSGAISTPCPSPSRPVCPLPAKTAPCTPAAMIFTLRCCWAPPGC